MNLKIQKECPKEGQFIVVWKHNGELWSDTCRIIDGKVEWYDVHDDFFVDTFIDRLIEDNKIEKSYIILEETP